MILSLTAFPVFATIPEEDAYNNAMDALFSVLAVSALVVIIIAIVVIIVRVVKKKK